MSSQRTISTLLASLLLLSGCLGDEASEVPEIEDCTGDSCENENTSVQEEDLVEEIYISGTNFCDNTNPDHCLLPFPSSAFLDPDSLTTTGYFLA